MYEWVDVKERYNERIQMSLVTSFVMKLKGDERIDGGDLCGLVFPLSSLSKYAGNRVIYRMKWMSAGNDGMVKMVSLYSISSYILSS